MACKDENDDSNKYWWMVAVVLIFGAIQMLIEWLVCIMSACICCVFFAYYFAQERERRADAIREFQRHAPMMARALENLPVKRFGDLDNRVKELDHCIICYEDFASNPNLEIT